MMEVFNCDEIQARMVTYLNSEVKLFDYGFPEIDKHYKFLLGNTTDITGYPYGGKTLLLNELLYNLSDRHGIQHLLHLPDAGKPEEVLALLIQKRTGKTFDKRYSNVITEEEIYKSMSWIDAHFKILKCDRRPTPKEFWEYSTKIDVQTASIDSWNYMRHEGEGTSYLADVLSFRNELAEKSKKHFFTIVHPRNPIRTDYDAQGILKPPTAFNIMGGSEWNNNAKNIIVVHCPAQESFEYDIYFRKIKPRIVGKTGFSSLFYDIRFQKFYTRNEGEIKYAYGEVFDADFPPIGPSFNPGEGFPDIEEEIPF